MSETQEILTPRKIKARKIVNGIIEGKSYTEIGLEVNPNANYPKQDTYQYIRNDYVQDEIKLNLEGDIASWNEEKIAQRIANLADNAKNDANKLKALELLAKWKAMLTEKREVSNKQSFETSKITKGISTEELIQELETRCKLSSQGINTSENVPQVGNNK